MRSVGESPNVDVVGGTRVNPLRTVREVSVGGGVLVTLGSVRNAAADVRIGHDVLASSVAGAHPVGVVKEFCLISV